MEPQVIVGLVVAGIVVVLFLVWYLGAEVRIRRALRKLPRIQVENLDHGQVARVVGEIEPGEQMLQAPLSGRACVFYEVVVEEWKQHGKHGSWREVIRESQAIGFSLHDGSGRAHVAMRGARLSVIKDATFKSGTFNSASPVLETFLARHGKTSTGFFGFNKSIRYQEGVLVANARVAIAGRWI